MACEGNIAPAPENGQEHIEDLIKELTKSVSPEILDKMYGTVQIDGKTVSKLVARSLKKSEDDKCGTEN